MTGRIKNWLGRVSMLFTLVAVSLAPHFALAVPDPWTFICDSDSCDTYFRQTAEGWTLVIICADGDFGSWTGDGLWCGTLTCDA